MSSQVERCNQILKKLSLNPVEEDDFIDKDLTMKELLNEIISSFSKADINEEVVRFKSHLDLVSKLTDSKNLIGKKLDFYSQEMLREINTLSSKAMIADIKNEAVELKSHIEKMKEHAQNVE